MATLCNSCKYTKVAQSGENGSYGRVKRCTAVHWGGYRTGVCLFCPEDKRIFRHNGQALYGLFKVFIREILNTIVSLTENYGHNIHLEPF